MYANAAKRSQLRKAIRESGAPDVKKKLALQTASKPALELRQANALIERFTKESE